MILAAGAGSRFRGGTHKLLAPVADGRPLVRVAVDHAVAAALDLTIVVTGAVDLDRVLPDGVMAVANPDWRKGQATSLQVAVFAARSAGADVVVVALGDQPGIDPAAWRAVSKAPSPITFATYGRRRGHPVRLAAAVWGLLPTTGEAGARAVAAGRPELVGEVACAGDPADVDTVEDLTRWS